VREMREREEWGRKEGRGRGREDERAERGEIMLF